MECKVYSAAEVKAAFPGIVHKYINDDDHAFVVETPFPGLFVWLWSSRFTECSYRISDQDANVVCPMEFKNLQGALDVAAEMAVLADWTQPKEVLVAQRGLGDQVLAVALHWRQRLMALDTEAPNFRARLAEEPEPS